MEHVAAIEKEIEEINRENFLITLESTKLDAKLKRLSKEKVVKQYIKIKHDKDLLWQAISENQQRIQKLQKEGGITTNTLPDAIIDYFQSEARAIAAVI